MVKEPVHPAPVDESIMATGEFHEPDTREDEAAAAVVAKGSGESGAGAESGHGRSQVCQKCLRHQTKDSRDWATPVDFRRGVCVRTPPREGATKIKIKSVLRYSWPK